MTRPFHSFANTASPANPTPGRVSQSLAAPCGAYLTQGPEVQPAPKARAMATFKSATSSSSMALNQPARPARSAAGYLYISPLNSSTYPQTCLHYIGEDGPEEPVMGLVNISHDDPGNDNAFDELDGGRRGQEQRCDAAWQPKKGQHGGASINRAKSVRLS